MTDDYGPTRCEELLSARRSDDARFPVAYADLKAAAEAALDGRARAYVSGGAGTEETMDENRAAFERVRIRPRMLRDVADRTLETEILDETFSVPFMLAPIGLQTLYHTEGEKATARAAGDLDVPLCLSTVASTSLEDAADELGDTPRWFQLYWWRDRDVAQSMVERAEAAGYTAIVLTVDAQLKGWRVSELTAASQPIHDGHGLPNFIDDPVFRSRLDVPPEDDLEAAIQQVLDTIGNLSLTWDDVEWLADVTDLPVVVKGILHPADAELACEHADGVVVSNHGGRQLDGELAALDALPAVVDAVDGEVPVLFDSGIRTGADVFRALALGADAVLLGRPYIYGLALGGEDGVRHVLKNLRGDLDLTLGLAGYDDVADVDRDAVVRRD